MSIPFNQPYMTGAELGFIAEAHAAHHLSGDGRFTRECSRWLEQRTGCGKVLLTHSCTAALEMAALLAGVGPGDEVIMPSYTFVSTANAFTLRGAVPVFVDIRPDTLNLDETLVEQAITPRTRAIVPVHYAGVGCEMDRILEIARERSLLVVEDAAQGVMATYHGRALGSIGDLGTLSFHETKNITCGEGGALLVNAPEYRDQADIVREKGTNRSLFYRGMTDKYTWVALGSSYLPSDLCAAFLWAQMQEADEITRRRLALWDAYHEAFAPLEASERARRPVIPDSCVHNAHMYYLLLPGLETRTAFIRMMGEAGISTVFHYVPLHSSPAGREYCRTATGMEVTDRVADTLVRLPLWTGLEERQPEVIERVFEVLQAIA